MFAFEQERAALAAGIDPHQSRPHFAKRECESNGFETKTAARRRPSVRFDGASVARNRSDRSAILRAGTAAIASGLVSGSIIAVFLALVLAHLVLADAAAAFRHVVVALAFLGMLLLVVLIAVRIVRLITHGEMVSV